MRWQVEVTSLSPGKPARRITSDVSGWQAALAEARAAEGDATPLASFTIDVLPSGYRATNPISRLRYDVQRVEDARAAATPAIPPGEDPPSSKRKKGKPSGPGSKRGRTRPQYGPEVGGGARLTEVGPTTPPRPNERGRPGPTDARESPERGEKEQRPTAPGGKSPVTGGPSVTSLPDVHVLFRREEAPTARAPLTYRELAVVLEGDASPERALVAARSELELLRREMDESHAPPGRLVRLAVFDHGWTTRPARPPLVTLTWKDWRGPEPEIDYPASPNGSARASASTSSPSASPVPSAPAPALAHASASSAAQSAAPRSAPIAPSAPVPIVGVASRSIGDHASAPSTGASPPYLASPPRPGPHPAAAAATAAPGRQESSPARDGGPLPAGGRRTVPFADDATMRAGDGPLPFDLPPDPVPEAVSAPAAPAPATHAPPRAPLQTQAPQAPSALGPGSSVARIDGGTDALDPDWTIADGVLAAVTADAPAPDASQPRVGSRRPDSRVTVPSRVGRPEDLMSEIFEAMHDLHFLATTDDGADFVLALLLEKIPTRVALIHIYDINAKEFVVRRGRAPRLGVIGARSPEKRGLIGSIVRAGKPVLLGDADLALPRPGPADDTTPMSQANVAPGVLELLDAKRPAAPPSTGPLASTMPPASGGPAANPAIETRERYARAGHAPKQILVAPVRQGARYLGVIELADHMDGRPLGDVELGAVGYVAEQFADFVADRGISLTDTSNVAVVEAPRRRR